MGTPRWHLGTIGDTLGGRFGAVIGVTVGTLWCRLEVTGGDTLVSFECRIWGHLRDVRGHFGDTSVPPLGTLVPFWGQFSAILGTMFCLFGDTVGTFGTTMGTLWGRFKCHIWGHFKVTHGDTGAILGTLRCHFSATFGDTLVPHLGTFWGHSNHVTSALPPGIRTRVPPAALSGRSSARSHAPLVANIADAPLTSSERAAR